METPNVNDNDNDNENKNENENDNENENENENGTGPPFKESEQFLKASEYKRIERCYNRINMAGIITSIFCGLSPARNGQDRSLQGNSQNL